METQNLLAFVRVAESGSFSIAAEALHLTQPAISKRVAALEEQLSARLFDRVGRQVRLTEAGRVLLPSAHRILQTVREARQHLNDLSGQVGGELNLGTSHHVGLHRLPPVLSQYVRQYPDVDLQLSFLDSEKAYAEVQSGRLDLAVVTLSPNPPPSIESRIIWDDPLRFVASPSHPLARRTSLTLGELCDYPAILPEAHTYTAQIVNQLFEARRLPLTTKLASNFLETIKMMVSIELGWSVLPETLIDEQLRVLPVDGIQLARTLGCILHKERSRSNAARRFLELIDGPD
ncbi:LysR family transcriptional regulator [Gilvimarinus sp. F26214L]|uniref:LysR family transcriptional regulator n=1 Tax=Gilvimarinus sp. DZF01 TaxID=3461371 RepID=UPI00404613B4